MQYKVPVIEALKRKTEVLVAAHNEESEFPQRFPQGIVSRWIRWKAPSKYPRMKD
jgi:hypothetical protein